MNETDEMLLARFVASLRAIDDYNDEHGSIINTDPDGSECKAINAKHQSLRTEVLRRMSAAREE